MQINGREVGFFYSVGAHCDYEDYVVQHQNIGITRAKVIKALAMNKAYNEANGIKEGALTEKEVMALPHATLTQLFAEIKRVEEQDSAISVRTKEIKKKDDSAAAE